jgi:hypothetical protein
MALKNNILDISKQRNLFLICDIAPLLLNCEVSNQFGHCYCCSAETVMPNLGSPGIIFGTKIDQFPNEILKFQAIFKTQRRFIPLSRLFLM